MDEVDIPCSDSEAASVNSSATLYTDVFLADGEYKSGPFGVRILYVIKRVERTQEGGILIYPEGHTILEVNRSGDIVTFVQNDTSTSLGRDEINRRLDAHRIEGEAVGDGAEIPREIVSGIEPLGSAG